MTTRGESDMPRRHVAADHEGAAAERRRALLDACHLGQRGAKSDLHGRDVYVSSLSRYLEALGGHLEIAAVLDGRRIPIRFR